MEDSFVHFTTNSPNISPFESISFSKNRSFENSLQKNLFNDNILDPIRYERSDIRMLSEMVNSCKSTTRSNSNPIREYSGIAASASSSPGRKFKINFKKNERENVIPKPEYYYEGLINKNLEENTLNVSNSYF